MRLFHEPPFVTARVVMVVARAHGTGFCAVGRVYVRADFDFKMLQGGAVVGFEEVVEHLAAVRLLVVVEEA